MNQIEFIAEVAQRLESAGIPFMLTGSHGSSYYGQPRSTNDVDFVIDPTSEQLDQFILRLGPDYYASREMAQDAFSHRSMFNIILTTEGLKADFIVRKDRPFSIEEFRRRREESIQGHRVPVVSPEDVILAKLEWNSITPSERQLQDAMHVVLTQGEKLDRSYLHHWAGTLGVANTLEEILKQADAATG